MQKKFMRLLQNRGGRIGPTLFALSLVVYLLTLCHGVFPGESARLTVQYTGLDFFSPMTHFLWGLFVKLLQWLPLFTLAVKLNAFSAVCGAGAVWLLYLIVSRIPHDRTSEELEVEFSPEPVQRLSGVVAALVFAFCIPFWIVSTRAHTASFDVLFLLFTVYLLFRFAETKNFGVLYLFSFLYGMGVTEYSTFIVFAPFIGLWIFYFLWREGLLRARALVLAVLCSVAGLFPYVLGAWQFQQTPAYELRNFKNLFEVIWYTWVEQGHTIRRSLPQVGWLLIIMTTLAPWLIVVAFPKRTIFARSAVRSSYLLHLLLGILAVAVLFNANVAPWSLTQFRPLLVMPYVFVAMWIGYLAGYGYLMVSKSVHLPGRTAHRLRRWGRVLYIPSILALIAVSAILNLSSTNGRAVDGLNIYARRIVDSLGGRRWLITNGQFDDLITIAAYEKDVPVTLLNTSLGSSAGYLKLISRSFDDPRLQGLLQVGMKPFLDEWLAGDGGVVTNVAVLSDPDVWVGAGKAPVPHCLVFFGSDTNATFDLNAWVEDQTAFLRETADLLKQARRHNKVLAAAYNYALMHVGKCANNTGVFLEDMGEKNQAFQAYIQARAMDTNNISSLLNALSLAQRDSLPETKALNEEFDRVLKNMHSKLRLWALSYYFGYVRHPEALAERGLAWAMSGRPGVAVREMQKAITMGAGKQRAELAIANFYFMQDKDLESEQVLDSLLKENPENQSALLGLARVSMRKADYESARLYLGRLKDSGAPESVVELEEALGELLAGNMSTAKELVEKLIEKEPKNLRAWVLLAFIANGENDTKTLDRCLGTLVDVAKGPTVLLTLAQIEMTRGNYMVARRYINEAVRIRPNDKQALEWLLQIDVAESKRSLAEEHLERLIYLDPKNAYGNMILGSLQYARQEFELAETSYRTSLETQRSSQALNDLAWILQIKGKLDEAEKMIRECLQLNDRNAGAWDTLGVVSMKQNRLDEAQMALQHALSLQPGNPQFIFHMAQLYELRGLKQEAMKLAEPLLVRPTEFEPSAFEDLRDLTRRLRTGS